MKKSQAAMEFLLTYGWAITVVLVAISALAYFGVLDPTKWFSTNTCTLPVGLSCMDSKVSVYGAVTLRNRLDLNIKNNLGAKISINSITISGYGGTANILAVYTHMPNGCMTGQDCGAGLLPNIQLNDITRVQLVGGLPAALLTGQQFNINFIVNVLNEDSGVTHDYPGTITGKVS